MTPRERDVDLDEDLFDFDELRDQLDGSEDLSGLDIEEFLASLPSEGPMHGPPPMEVDPDGPAAPTPARKGSGSAGAAPPARSATTAGLPRTWWLGLVLLAAGNALLAFVVWQGGRASRTELDRTRAEFDRAAYELRRELDARAEDLAAAATPVAQPLPQGESDLERARLHLEAGEFDAARRDLYALLAVVDGLPAERRADVEARARFLLADVSAREARALREAQR